jgi:hypothetical protein
MFNCSHCGAPVSPAELIGTRNRNHCSHCLWSKHVDLEKPGDRKSSCQALMRPIGLTFKKEALDKYGKSKQGELMLIHQCSNPDCGKISINRIAGDDNPEVILEVFRASKILERDLKKKLEKDGIKLLTGNDEGKIRTQLFGKP